MYGLVVACSPLPVLVAVLMIAESRRLRSAVALGAGWFVSIACTAVAGFVAAAAVPHENLSSHRRLLGFGDLALGIVVAALALRTAARVRRDPHAGAPSWLGRVGSMAAVPAFALGVFIPPSVIALAAGNALAAQHSGASAVVAGLVVFSVVGSVGVSAPTIAIAVQPGRAEDRLTRWRSWLAAHWQQVLAVLLACVSVYLVAKGLFEIA